jgi:hypothetical protein
VIAGRRSPRARTSEKAAPIAQVVAPKDVPRHCRDRLRYNQSAKRLESALVGREHTVIADVAYRRGDGPGSPRQNGDR